MAIQNSDINDIFGISESFQRAVTDTEKANAEFQSDAGMAPKIVCETAGDYCEWCDGLTGEYTYTDVPDDVYKRHKNCNCTVGFYPGESKRQNVHTRKREEAPEVLERGKAIGLSFDSKADIPLVSSQDGHTRGQKRTIQNLLKLAPPEARGQV